MWLPRSAFWSGQAEACPARSLQTCSTVRRLILFLLLFPTLALAGTWGLRGITKRFLVRGDRVYAIDGRGVAVYDASALTKIATAETEAESLDGAFVGDTLVVLTRAGFERFTPALQRISAQETPPATRVASNGELVAAGGPGGVRIWRGAAQIGSWMTDRQVSALAWRGNALFVAADTIGVQVLDGESGAPIGTVGETALDIAVDGDFLYAASGYGGLAIYDVRDPLNAQLVSRTAPSEGFYQLVAVSAGRVVVAEETRRVRVFDVSAPAAPRAFAPFDQPAQAVAVSGAKLFVSGSNIDPVFTNIEVATGIPLRAYDLAQPDAPRLAGEVHDLAGPLSGAATDGTFAYVSDPPFFRVIDVSTTSAPVEAGSLRVENIEPYVKVSGNRVILYGNGTVQYIDVSNPRKPRLGGVYESLGRPPSAAAIARNAFIEGNTWSGFHVFDFLPDGSSRFLSGIKTHPVDIVTYGDAAYYIVEWQSIGVADVSGVAQLKKAIVLPSFQLAQTKDLLLARDLKSIHVFSLADPFEPVEISALAIDPAGVLGADGDSAYVATAGSVVRMDLANPANPSFQPTGMRAVAPSQIAASGGKVVIADRYALRVYGADTPPPPAPAPARRRAIRP
jgi:hypothetical protein